MSIPFPPTLQQKLNDDSFTLSFGNTSIRSTTDIGPAKVRRRSTRPINTITGSIYLNASEYSVFETFYNTSINGGVNKFTLPHPITGISKEFRFTKDPVIKNIGPILFSVSMELEML